MAHKLSGLGDGVGTLLSYENQDGTEWQNKEENANECVRARV